jgi:hypothetical protein
VRTSRYASRSALVAAIVGVVMLAGTAACGSSASSQSASTTPSANPLAGLTGDQIAAKAVADLKAASSVHIAGSVTESGSSYGVDLTPGTTDCTGTLVVQGKGSFALLKIGQTLWIKPDNQFWKSAGASSAVLQLVGGKWIQTSTSDSNFSSVNMLCSPAQLADSLGNKLNHVVKGTTTVIAGQSALQLRDTSTSDSAYVTISAAPEFLRLNGGSSGQLDFSDYNAPVTLTPPPASETIDGSTIGL